MVEEARDIQRVMKGRREEQGRRKTKKLIKSEPIAIENWSTVIVIIAESKVIRPRSEVEGKKTENER